jgi:hypothetical protein
MCSLNWHPRMCLRGRPVLIFLARSWIVRYGPCGHRRMVVDLVTCRNTVVPGTGEILMEYFEAIPLKRTNAVTVPVTFLQLHVLNTLQHNCFAMVDFQGVQTRLTWHLRTAGQHAGRVLTSRDFLDRACFGCTRLVRSVTTSLMRWKGLASRHSFAGARTALSVTFHTLAPLGLSHDRCDDDIRILCFQNISPLPLRATYSPSACPPGWQPWPVPSQTWLTSIRKKSIIFFLRLFLQASRSAFG